MSSPWWAALLAVAIVFPLTDEAAARRRSTEHEAPPPPNLDYDAAAATCAPAYATALQGLFARQSPQPLATARLVRTPMAEVGPRWIFHPEGDRRRQRDDVGRLVEGDKVCAEELPRGGRVRCASWEQRQASSEPVVPVPQPTKDEARIIRAVTEMVSHKGAPPEFLSNGRYTIMTERVATDLEAYALQPPHPAMCTGADELIDFLSEKLAPLKKRAGDVASLRTRSLEAIAPRVAAVEAALAQPAAAVPSSAGEQPSSGEANSPQSSPAVLAGAAPQAGKVTVASGRPVPTTPAGWLAEVAALVLVPADAATVTGEATPLAGLRRFAVLLAEGRSPAPAAARAEAKAGLRTIEAAVYVDLLARRYDDLNQALFETMDDVRKAHATHCTCGG